MEQQNEFFDFFKNTKNPVIKNIRESMKKLGIHNEKDYTINEDYSVNLKKDTLITVKRVEECPVVFNICDGNFTWHYTDLKSMKNLPKQVNGNMSVAYNALRSLEDCPTILVTGQFNCSGNKMQNLKGCENMKPKQFIAMGCGLKSLEGSPKEISGDFLVGMNDLESLVGGPIKIDGIYDCSNNNLTSLDGLGKCKRVNSTNNPISETKKEGKKDAWSDEANKILTQRDIKTQKPKEEDYQYKYNDKIILNKPSSVFDKMIGTIWTVGNNEYSIKFKREDNPGLVSDKDGGLANVKSKYLKKYVKKFKVDDYVLFTNPNSKYTGLKGTIMSIDEDGHKVHFEFDDNPGLKELVPATSTDKGYINLLKIKDEQLESTKKSLKKDKDNKLNVGDVVKFAGKDVKILELKSPIHWLVEYTEGPDKEPFSVHYESLYKIKTTNKKESKKDDRVFRSGDKIIYLDPDGELDECKGVVSYAFNGIIDVKITRRDGKIEHKMNVNTNKLERAPVEPKKPRPFKDGDSVRYINSDSPFDGQIGKVEDVKGNNCVILIKFGTGNLVHLDTSPENLTLLEEASDSKDFKYGQIIQYNNPTSKSFGRIGTFEGLRPDGKTTIKFDDDISYMKLILDPDEAEFIEAHPGPLPKKSTPTYTTTGYTTSYTAPKKKKKVPEKVKPVLVYNRRNVARKAYAKPEEPVETPIEIVPPENKGIDRESL